MNLDKWNIFGVLTSDFKSKIKSAFVFGDGNEALMVTVDDEVYGLGQNQGSCLGIDATESTLVPKKIEPLCGKLVKAFCCGSGPHVVALTESGEVYVWGHNKFGELGNEGPSTRTPSLLPAVTEDMIIEEIVCGGNHTLALGKNGKVYGWGQNSHGQIEYNLRTNIMRPKQIANKIGSKIIKSIACTNSASFAVSNSGKVYAWGNKESGQLGVSHDTSMMTQPFKIPGLENNIIVKVVCGYSHVLALSDAGNLLAWGSNNCGQLGIGTKSNYHLPTITAVDIGRIVDVAASPFCNFSAALTLKREVYVWGQFRGHSITSPLLTQLKLLSDAFACFAKPTVMNNLLPVHSEDNSSVIESMKQAFNNSAESDFTIVVESKQIHVHKDILKIRSEYFRSMFRGEWKEHQQGPLQVEKFSYNVYKAYLYYLYTDVVDIEQDSVLGLLELSNYLCEENLKRNCESIIKNIITPENAVLFYIAGITYNTKELEDFALNYSFNHMTAVVESEAFSSFDLETMKSFIQKASKARIFRS